MVAPPSLQFSGIPGLAEGVDYCGNAFGDVPPIIASTAERQPSSLRNISAAAATEVWSGSI